VIEEEIEQESTPPANRMAIAALALIGLLISIYLTLHKYGYIGQLICGTGSCETVQTSKWAVLFGVPVPVLGVVGYLVILVLAIISLQPSLHHSRAMSLVLFIVADGAFMFSLYLSFLEQFKIHAWCRWCIGSAVISVLIWFCALVELPRLRRIV
jgi:uncharacterized membrane protein